MTGLPLEDFAAPAAPPPMPAPVSAGPEPAAYDDAYNAGWDDAMAQIDEEQGRIGERLAERLAVLERGQAEALGAAVSALEPLLHEIFDKLLPRAANRGFLGVLLEEVSEVLTVADGTLSIQVAPEEAPRLARLLERADMTPDRVTIRPEPALALSQALVRWEGGERRVDLEAVLAALDDALDGFLSTFSPETQE